MSFIDRAIIGARFMLGGASVVKLFVHSTWNFLRYLANLFRYSHSKIVHLSSVTADREPYVAAPQTFACQFLCWQIIKTFETYLFAAHRDKLSVGKSC